MGMNNDTLDIKDVGVVLKSLIFKEALALYSPN
jgi:hypothetical protein